MQRNPVELVQSNTVQSVVRAFRILEVLDQARDDALPLGKLARAVGLKPPTVHNLLRTLVTLGYVERVPGSHWYALGRKAWDLGRARFGVATLVEAARPAVDALRNRLRETVILAIYRDGLRHTILSAESPRALRVGADIGADARLYDTATGRVLLSLLEARELVRFVDTHGLPGGRWAGIDSLDALRGMLRKVRTAEFAFYERPDGGVHAAAVSVPLADARLPAALGAYFPASRPPEGGRRALQEMLKETAAWIAARFGRTE